MLNSQVIKVVIATIYNANKQILITKRGYNRPHPGKWELPGGKIATNEKPQEALSREINEELGIHIIHADFFTNLKFSYPDKKVELMVYKVNEYRGKPTCCEDQLELKWVDPEELILYEFLEANYPIIDKISKCY